MLLRLLRISLLQPAILLVALPGLLPRLVVIEAVPIENVAYHGTQQDTSNHDTAGISSDVWDVLVYGSTPSGIMAAVAASRHLNNLKGDSQPHRTVALLSQRSHIGGMCTGGLGQTDVGNCADEVIGGLALEFFQRNLQYYNKSNTITTHHSNFASNNHRIFRKWNLEPHVANQIFRDMIDQAGIILLPFDQVVSVHMMTTTMKNQHEIIDRITVTSGISYKARVFIDASYEGDLMARVPNLTYIVGRESQQQYNESYGGSGGPGRRSGIVSGIEYMDPFLWEEEQEEPSNGTISMKRKKKSLLPLLQKDMPLPHGHADKEVQAYNFRLCVTNDTALRVPFEKPDSYNSRRWELLRRFWKAWYNSTNPHKKDQAKVPTARLFQIPSSSTTSSIRSDCVTPCKTKTNSSSLHQQHHNKGCGCNGGSGGNRMMKFDMNNCEYNPIHTDFIGNSRDYPEADYKTREKIWQQHMEYTKEFLWFMSSDQAVPRHIRDAFRNDWGYCGDEFLETNHFPPQLYVREARRLVGDQVWTQNDIMTQQRYHQHQQHHNHPPSSIGNQSIGMGCYGFDSHCVRRYACTDPKLCKLYDKPYVEVGAGTETGKTPGGVYQIPWTVLLPQKSQVTNLLVSVCVSASHVAYSTVRMEPQYMIMGHAAGAIAVLAIQEQEGEQQQQWRQQPEEEESDVSQGAPSKVRNGGSAAGAAGVVQDINVDQLQALLQKDGQYTALAKKKKRMRKKRKNTSGFHTSAPKATTD